MWTEEILDNLLIEPTEALVGDMSGLNGDVLILGAGGKMGPTLAVMCKRALEKAGSRGKVFAVSRFTDPLALAFLRKHHVEAVSADLMEEGVLERLPDAENIVFMAGLKFGTFGNEVRTWAMNARLPVLVSERYKGKRIVVFSSGNVYPQTPLADGGSSEAVPPAPVGDYGASVLARERMFEYAAAFGSKIALFRLFYAVDLRYGVLCDIASGIMSGNAVSLGVPAFNCIWQADASEYALRLLPRLTDGVTTINVTGPETASTRSTAIELGKLLGREPVFSGEAGPTAIIGNAGLCFETFGYPSVPLRTMIKWQAEWILAGGRTLNKPTHFEEKEGRY